MGSECVATREKRVMVGCRLAMTLDEGGTDVKFTIHDPVNRSQRADAADDVGVNKPQVMTIGDVIASRYNRRDVMKGALGFTAIAATVSPMALVAGGARAQGASSFDFEEIEAGVSETHVVAPGYDADVLIRWGDPVLPGAPEFDVQNQTAAAQNQQFGYNSDFIGTVRHPEAPDDPNRLILVNNHEYTNEELMFPGIGMQDDAEFAGMTEELVNIEKAAHGGSIIEIQRGEDGKWSVVRDSSYNRRITAETPMRISGPAAGHGKMQTNADPSGTEVRGTFNNCAGGITPWGTWLMAEENFHGYFWSDQQEPPATGDLGRPGDDPQCALRRARQVVRLGQVRRPLQHRQGAERAKPARLDRRGEPGRPRPRRRSSAPRWAGSSTRARCPQ